MTMCHVEQCALWLLRHRKRHLSVHFLFLSSVFEQWASKRVWTVTQERRTLEEWAMQIWWTNRAHIAQFSSLIHLILVRTRSHFKSTRPFATCPLACFASALCYANLWVHLLLSSMSRILYSFNPLHSARCPKSVIYQPFHELYTK